MKKEEKRNIYMVYACHGTNLTRMHGIYSLNSNGRKKTKNKKKYLQPQAIIHIRSPWNEQHTPFAQFKTIRV
jgi:hypothetical protein